APARAHASPFPAPAVGVGTGSCVSVAAHDGQRRISGEPRVRVSEPAAVRRRAAPVHDAPHRATGEAETDATHASRPARAASVAAEGASPRRTSPWQIGPARLRPVPTTPRAYRAPTEHRGRARSPPPHPARSWQPRRTEWHR